VAALTLLQLGGIGHSEDKADSTRAPRQPLKAGEQETSTKATGEEDTKATGEEDTKATGKEGSARA
jgi:hypothetical protein